MKGRETLSSCGKLGGLLEVSAVSSLLRSGAFVLLTSFKAILAFDSHSFDVFGLY